MLGLLLSMTMAQSCTVQATFFSPREPVLLQLRDGTVWGQLQRPPRRPSARATFSPSGIELALEGLGLHITTRSETLRVFSREPLDFGAGFVSGRATPLALSLEPDGRAALVPAPRADVKPLGAWTARRRSCAELRLEELSERSGVGESQLAREATLFDARGRPTFLLPPRTMVRRLPRGEVRVLLEDGASIAGWLHDATRSDTFTFQFESSRHCYGPPQPPPRECSEALELFVTDGKRAEAIGTLDAATFFDVGETEHDWTSLTPRESFFALTNGWRFVVRATALARCLR